MKGKVSAATLCAVLASTAAAPVHVSVFHTPHKSRFNLSVANPITECPVLPPREPPSDIRDLRFTDIKLVGALGDSITAGFALNNLPLDNKADTWCCGDKPDAITLSNMIKHSNPSVIAGASKNVAVTGAVVSGMAGQARRFVDALKADRNVDFANDWKLVNIWIGANNECPSCRGSVNNQPPAYERDLRVAVDILEAEVPRLFVNLIAMLNLTGLTTAGGVTENCALQHALLTRNLCPCAFPTGGTDGDFMDGVVQANNAIMYKLQDEIRGRGRRDFAAIVQPGLQDLYLPDWTYLSRLDCFHPSLLAHEQIALGMINNMQQPVGDKQTEFEIPVKLRCPTAESVIYS